jgi:hypothetical protein
MIEKRQVRHVETSKVEAFHESDIVLLGNRADLQAIALLCRFAPCHDSARGAQVISLS